MTTPPLLAEGVRLFNQRRYFEAHEVLEQAWLAEPGGIRSLYQGVLQVGVGLHHAARGNRDGGLRLIDRGTRRLREFAPEALGLDVAGLLEEAARARAAIAAGQLEPDPAPRARLLAGPAPLGPDPPDR